MCPSFAPFLALAASLSSVIHRPLRPQCNHRIPMKHCHFSIPGQKIRILFWKFAPSLILTKILKSYSSQAVSRNVPRDDSRRGAKSEGQSVARESSLSSQKILVPADSRFSVHSGT
jgi:hypothetical protein